MTLDFGEILDYLTGKDDEKIFTAADDLRRKVFGDAVYLRGIIEFSNYCKENCLYCGLRRANRRIIRYRLNFAEIMACAAEIAAAGVATIVLQAGDDPYYTPETIADIIKAIKSRYPVAVTLSLGEHDEETYKLWRDAGADRYLLKIETFDQDNYRRLRPGKFWDERRKCVKLLRKLGYEIGSGIMVGLPGETHESLALAIQQLSMMKLPMIGLGPFVVHPQTPLASKSSGDLNLSYRTLALIRLLNPYANIPATGALDSLQPGARQRGLQIGANVIMPTFTPNYLKEHYNIYPGKNISGIDNADSLQSALRMIKRAGYAVSYARGDSPIKFQISNPKPQNFRTILQGVES
jgi:biotin synthase